MGDAVRYVRSLVFISISGYLLVRAKAGINKVNRKEIAVTVETEFETEVREFPLLTFCPMMKEMPHRSIKTDREPGEVSLFNDVKLSDIINTAPFVEQVIKGKPNHPPLTGKWTQSFFFYSHVLRPAEDRIVESCYTYQHGKSIKVGSDEDHLYFNIEMERVQEIRLAVHDKFGYISSHYNLDDRRTIVFEQLPDDQYRHLRMEVEPKVYKKMEIEIRETTGPGSAHCIPTQIHDEECLEHAIEDSLGCKLSWLINSTSNARFCASSDDLLDVIDMIPDERRVSPNKLRYYLNSLNCSLPCKYNSYLPRIIYDRFDDRTEINKGIDLIVHLWNGERKIFGEVLNYDTTNFIGEIGGYVGLLLGYSFLSLFDSVYGYATDVYELCAKRARMQRVKQMRMNKSAYPEIAHRPQSTFTHQSYYSDVASYQGSFNGSYQGSMHGSYVGSMHGSYVSAVY